MDLVFARWTSHVLWTHAHHGRQRFAALQSQLPATTPNVLAERLRRLERDGFVARRDHREIPPRVGYEITPQGRVVPIFRKLATWSGKHPDTMQPTRRRYDLERATRAR